MAHDMIPLLLVGGGGHARSCIDVIEATGQFAIAGVIDRAGPGMGPVLGYPVIGGDEDLEHAVRTTASALVTVGQVRTAAARIALFDRLVALGASLPVVVSPLARVARTADIGAGTILLHGAIANSLAVVGRNCIVNTNALLEHDTVVDDHCHVSTGAILNGGVTVGSGSFVGSGAVVREGVTIGSGCLIGAGAVVIADLPDGTTYVGLP